MGCLGIGVAALLALAVPASIAGTSLPGAYLTIALLAVLAAAAVLARSRIRGSRQVGAPDAVPVTRRPATALAWIAALALTYAVVVTAIHQLR